MTVRSPQPAVRSRLGVIGTFVWDTIYGRDPQRTAVEEWGGIAYALGALDAALPGGWEIVPVIKVGSDLADRARQFLSTMRRLAPDAALIEVAEPNNRVTLRYVSRERRTEHLSGGVAGWSWGGLKPLLRGLDALYVNLISGFELDLETARLLRLHFAGPIYCDLHSVVLAVRPDGLRTWQPLADAEEWCRCFDIVQMNEDELAMMAPDPMALASRVLGRECRCLLVTLGPRGAAYFATDDFLAGSALRRGGPVRGAAVHSARVEPAATTDVLDPTGCGDVWGATCFSRLLADDKLPAAMQAANRAAARNLAHRGATGLAHHLRGELSPT